MKAFALLSGALLLLGACSDPAENSAAAEKTSENGSAGVSADFEKKVFSFSAADTETSCTEDSQMVCAINQVIRCTINPKTNECIQNKGNMPGFIFMEDESLGRPTEQSYQITKMKPLANGQVEVYTKGTCNGKWFGLCQGNIIYVMAQRDNAWLVTDIYALESN